MATLEEIQIAIDNKSLAPEDLTPSQREAIDTYIDSGQLKGPKMSEIIEQRDTARVEIAEQKTGDLQPFTEATGIQRSDVELAGEATGAIIPFIKNRDLLAKEMTTLGLKSQFGVSPQGLAAIEQRKFQFDKYEKLYKNLPVIRNFKMLSRTGAVLGRMRDGFRLFLKAGPTNLLATEAKSVLAATGGAALGSLSYDAANFATDLAVANKEDMARVKDADIEKLPAPQRVLTHALEAASNASLFNAGAFALGPMFSMMGSGMKSILGLQGDDAVRIAQKAKQTGVPTNLNALINEDAGFVARGLKSFLNTFGIFPAVAGPGARNVLNMQKETYRQFLEHLSVTPYANAEVLGYAGVKDMVKNYGKYHAIIDTMYKDVYNTALRVGGDRKLIPVENLRKSAEETVNYFKSFYPKIDLENIGKEGVTELSDPLVQYIARLKNLSDYNVGDRITAAEFIGLNRSFTKAYQQTKFYDARDLIKRTKYAMETDFNSATSADNLSRLLQSKSFKGEYDTILSERGQEAADAFVKKTTKDLVQFNAKLLDANSTFTNMVRPFFYGKTARGFRKIDENMFTGQGLIGIAGRQAVNRDEAWSKVIKQNFRDGSAESMKELKMMMNTKADKNGAEMFNRFRSLYLFDAFHSAATNQKGKQLLRPSAGGLMDDIIEEGTEKGVFRPFVDDIAGTRVGETIDTGKYLASGLGTRKFKELKHVADEVTNIDVDAFKKNLGLVGEDANKARNRLIEMYGGGVKGREGYQKLMDIIEVMEANASYDIGDVSRFVKRRLMLGGSISGGIIAGAGIGSGGALPVLAFLALSRMTGNILTNPKYMDTILKSVDPALAAKAYGESAQLSKRRQMAILLNNLFEERKDAPEVDPNLINADEIQAYLQGIGPQMPEAKFGRDGVGNKEEQKRFYQEEDYFEKLNPEQKKIFENFFNGNNNAYNLEQQIETEIENAPPTTAPMNQATQPIQPIQATQPINPVQTAQNFQSLFPQDNLGQAIANKGMNNA